MSLSARFPIGGVFQRVAGHRDAPPLARFAWPTLLATLLLGGIFVSVELQPSGAAFRFGWPQVCSGDEPHYLVMLNSLLADGDLDVANNYASAHAGSRQAGKRFAGWALDHHVKWYEGERLVTWYDAFEMPHERWRKDASGHPVPTLKRGLARDAAPKKEYSWHPPGLAILLFPLLCPLSGTSFVEPAALCCSALAVLSAALLFQMLVARYTHSRDWAWFVTAIAFLGTPAWHYSRTLFCEPFLLAGAVAAFAVTFRWPTRRGYLCGGALLAAGVLMKPPIALLAVPLAIGALWSRDERLGATESGLNFHHARILSRRNLARIALLAGPIGAALGFLFLLNHQMHGAPGRSTLRWESGNPIAGTLGLLFSANNGLVTLSPVAVVAFLAWPSFVRRHVREALLLLLGVILYFLLMATWIAYHGGACYGPRLIMPVVPLFFISLATVRESAWWQSKPFRAMFIALAATSILINALGAICAAQVWNVHPLRVLATCLVL